MIKRKILACILLFFFTFSCLMPYCRAEDSLYETDRVPEPAALSLNAKAAYLLDTSTGDVLYAMNENDQLYPASTTKIMTCYLTLKYGNLNDLYTLPDEISSGMDEDSSTSNLLPGEELYISELLQCLMISSANEAANALAIYISGSIDDFVDLMNEEAEALGCTNTHFENPNGLHSDEHYTSAKDLALITLAALEFDTFRNICGTSSATIRATNFSEARTLTNTNYLLSGTDFPGYDYDGAEGVKTGHTTPAGYCLVSLASRSGHELLGVVLGASLKTSGDEVQIGSFTETISMLDWGFENYDTALVYQQYLAETEAAAEAAAYTADDESTDNTWNTLTEDTETDTEPDIESETAEEITQDDGSYTNESSAEEGLSDLEAAAADSEETEGDMITGVEDSAAEDALALVENADTDGSSFEKLAFRMQISSADLILLFSGCGLLVLLLVLIMILCCVKRKQVLRNEL